MEFAARIAPFPVLDSAGRPVELAFLGGLNSPRPQLFDIDSDGDLDLFVQEYTDRVAFFENRGVRDLPRFVWRSAKFADLDVGEWYRFVDLDRDGDLDLLAEQPFSYIRYLRNEGTSVAPRFAVVADTLRDSEGEPIFSDRQNIPEIGDLDCDGRLDLLIGRLDGTVTRYEMEDTSDIPTFRLLAERFGGIEIIGQFGGMHGANTMALADLDGDGDPDLLWGDFFEPGLLLIENTGSCADPAFARAPAPFPADRPLRTSGYNAPALGDLDGDARLDLAVGVLGGAYNPASRLVDNLYLYTREPDGAFTLRTRRLLPILDFGSESIPALVDIDGDGDLDLLAANKIEPDDATTSRIYWLENVGNARDPELRWRGPLELGGAFHFAPAFGDLDGDGDPDLLLGSWRPHVAWYRNDGGSPVPHFTLIDSAAVTLTRGSNATPALGDLDGDSDLDLLVGEASGALNLYRNDGTPTAPRFVLVSDEYAAIDVGRRSAPAMVDLDGDGDLDLLVGSGRGGVLFFINSGSATEPRFADRPESRLEAPPFAAPAAGDMDGDGDLDLVIGGAGGGLLYYEAGPAQLAPERM